MSTRSIAASACGFGLLLGPGCARAEERSWEQRMSEVERLQQDGSHLRAEAILLALLDEVDNFPPGDSRTAVTCYNLGQSTGISADPTGPKSSSAALYRRGKRVSDQNHARLLQPAWLRCISRTVSTGKRSSPTAAASSSTVKPARRTAPKGRGCCTIWRRSTMSSADIERLNLSTGVSWRTSRPILARTTANRRW